MKSNMKQFTNDQQCIYMHIHEERKKTISKTIRRHVESGVALPREVKTESQAGTPPWFTIRMVPIIP